MEARLNNYETLKACLLLGPVPNPSSSPKLRTKGELSGSIRIWLMNMELMQMVTSCSCIVSQQVGPGCNITIYKKCNSICGAMQLLAHTNGA